MPANRPSRTNTKIQAILDDALRATIPDAPANDERAKNRRRRLDLYGAGEGAALPRLLLVGQPSTTKAGVDDEDILKRGRAWYAGGVGRSANVLADAARYGPRGVGCARFSLGDDNAWAPPLKGAPLKPGSAPLPTPRLWPENSTYVHGFKARYSNQRPTSSWYARQTTPKAEVSKHLKRVHVHETRLKKALLDAVEHERRDDRRRVLKKSLSLSAVDRREPTPLSSTVFVRYAGSSGTYFLVAASPLDENRLLPSSNRVSSTDLYRYELKWHEINAVCCKTAYCDLSSDDVAEALKNVSSRENGDVDRDSFAGALEKLLGWPISRGNLLFSLFDQRDHGKICYADVVSRIIAIQRDTCETKSLILDLWRLRQTHCRDDAGVVAALEAVLTTCAQSTEEHKEMRDHHLRPLHNALTRRVLLRPSRERPETADETTRRRRYDGIFDLEPVRLEDLDAALDEAPRSLEAFCRHRQALLRALRKKSPHDQQNGGVATKLERRVDAIHNNVKRRVTDARRIEEKLPMKVRYSVLRTDLTMRK